MFSDFYENSELPKPKIIVHFFVYKRDELLVPEAVLCVKRALPEADIVVIDDGNFPCSDKIRRWVQSVGGRWRTSYWPRGGNLRGKKCITGILEELLNSSTGCHDVLVKIDSDTCLLNGEDIREFSCDPNKVMCGAGKEDERIYGFCYCLKAYAARQLLDIIREHDVNDIAGEDVVIGFSACRVFPEKDRIMLFRTDEEDSTWTAYDWSYYPELEKYLAVSVITVGNKLPSFVGNQEKAVIMKNLRINKTH